MKRLFVLAALFLAVVTAAAQTPDDQYVSIYNLMQDADSVVRDQPAVALSRYREAYAALQSFAKGYPDWNEKVVQFRLSYLARRISTLSAEAPQTAAPSTPVRPERPAALQAPAPAPIPPPDPQNRIAGLEDQVRQLQADRSVLEAKLKEALSLQPAASDPRELEKAEQRIRDLEKEKDLLKVGLEQAQARSPVASDPKALEQAQQDLANANLKLTAEAQRSAALEAEKKELQSKLSSLIPGNWNAENIEKTRSALAEAKQETAEHLEAAEKFKAQRDALQAKINALTSEAETAKVLRAENEILKKQLADLKSPGADVSAKNQSSELSRVQALVATLDSEKNILRLEKVALENRLKQLLGAAAGPSDAAKRIQDLEKERDGLQLQLNAKPSDGAPRVKELEEQMALLRLKIEVLEARKIPYTVEELALFQKPGPSLAETQPPKTTRQLPSGTTLLAAEAKRAFAAREFDKAEAAYVKVLSQEEKNVLTLANLAAIQIERGKFEEAEKTSATLSLSTLIIRTLCPRLVSSSFSRRNMMRRWTS